MMDVRILRLTVELAGSFFKSSRDALQRARSAKLDQSPVTDSTGLNIFSHRQVETQASLESVVFSFLTIEATINDLFFRAQQSGGSKGLHRWLREKWKRGLSVHDRFVLFVSQYVTGDLDDFYPLGTLFSEFISFRNRIVHAHPEQYHALVEPAPTSNDLFVHDVEPICNAKGFPVSGLSQEIGRICLEDASRGFEIMLIILSFLDEQFVGDLEFPWTCKDGTSKVEYCRPTLILQSLATRHYPEIDPSSFVPEIISKLKKAEPAAGGEDK